MSAASAISAPPPSTQPCKAATTGLRRLRTAVAYSTRLRNFQAEGYSASEERSLPAQKARSVPLRRRTTRTASSLSSSAHRRFEARRHGGCDGIEFPRPIEDNLGDEAVDRDEHFFRHDVILFPMTSRDPMGTSAP